MKLCVIGSGYVGLVAGACFAATGNTVICADVDQAKIDGLKEGILPIYEPGLKDIVLRNMEQKRLSFTTDVPTAIRASQIVIIAVGTPEGEDGSADLRHVLAVAGTIGENLDAYKVVVCKSTVPVGTCHKVRDLIADMTDVEFDVVSNPEFLKEGSAINDFNKPDRVIVGSDSDRARELMSELYAPYMRSKNRLIHMDVRSSEMTKYASNAMLATKISFMNEIARLCDTMGADVENVRLGMSADVRIGPHFIYPGCGYGGSCFPKDVKALVGTGREHDTSMQILESVEAVNSRQKEWIFRRLNEHFDDLKGKTIAVWGLAFKPRTDDMREAPSIITINHLLEAGAKVRASDPVAMDTARDLFGDKIEFVRDGYECLEGADALVVHTEWPAYRNPDFQRMHDLMNTPVVADGRNIWKPSRMNRLGFTYYSIGRLHAV